MCAFSYLMEIISRKSRGISHCTAELSIVFSLKVKRLTQLCPSLGVLPVLYFNRRHYLINCSSFNKPWFSSLRATVMKESGGWCKYVATIHTVSLQMLWYTCSFFVCWSHIPKPHIFSHAVCQLCLITEDRMGHMELKKQIYCFENFEWTLLPTRAYPYFPSQPHQAS